MSELFDLDAIEDEGEPFRWKFGGVEFEFPGDPSVEAMEYMTKGDVQTALFCLLGREAYEQLDGLDQVLTRGKFDKLLSRYFRHVGIDLGKSSGPSRSARRAKATRVR